jgi:hypothetical protein
MVLRSCRWRYCALVGAVFQQQITALIAYDPGFRRQKETGEIRSAPVRNGGPTGVDTEGSLIKIGCHADVKITRLFSLLSMHK